MARETDILVLDDPLKKVSNCLTYFRILSYSYSCKDFLPVSFEN